MYARTIETDKWWYVMSKIERRTGERDAARWSVRGRA